MHNKTKHVDDGHPESSDYDNNWHFIRQNHDDKCFREFVFKCYLKQVFGLKCCFEGKTDNTKLPCP